MTNLGIRVYGFGSAALGVAGLVWGDFALVWQPVPASVPGRTTLAYLTGVILTVAGAALFSRRSAAAGAATLAGLYALGVLLLHAPHVTAQPLDIGAWGGVAEQLALVVGGFLAFVASADFNIARAAQLRRVGQLVFGICLVIFGIVHFRYGTETAAMVPKWLPPGQMFWAYATGVGHIAAGIALLSSIWASLAAKLITVMFASFAVFVHAPLLFADPRSHLNWVMNAMNLSLTGAAWVVAESLRSRSAQHIAPLN
jgi:uncharacterized membrane protein